jgi:serine/threonine-protein kinase
VSWRDRTRRLLPYVIAATSGFLIAYLVAAFVIFPAPNAPSERGVPAVSGLPYEAAARRLEQAGFVAEQGEGRYHATASEGIVLGQRPAGDTRLPLGGKVRLDVSRGQARATVPSVTGLPRHLAELTVSNAGLRVADVRTQESTAPRGEVIGTDPVEGSDLAAAKGVTLFVSAGPSQMAMPDVVGQSFPQARVLLEQVGLRTRAPVYDTTSFQLPSTVLSQTPAAGDTVARGTRVTLVVAGGVR